MSKNEITVKKGDRRTPGIFHSLVIDMDNGIFQLNGEELTQVKSFSFEMTGDRCVSVCIKRELLKSFLYHEPKETD